MIDISVEQLSSEGPGPIGLGENLTGDDLYAGYIPDRSLLFSPQTVIGDGLAGPVNDQPLQIFRDNRVIATDELGMQGPFHLEQGKLARHRAGRMFPLNYDWVDSSQQGLTGLVPEQDARQLSPLEFPGEYPEAHSGFMPVEVIGNPTTVFYTVSPDVGFEGY